MYELNTRSIIAVIGAGTMGRGIAQVAANSGHRVFLYDNKKGVAAAGINDIANDLDKLVKRGKKTTVEVNRLIALITPCEQIEEIATANLVIEAIIEDLSIKQSVFKQVQKMCDASTILASNTSSISITSIAAGLDNPEVMIGMHFFNPAPIMKLVEVISGICTHKGIAKQVFNLAKQWGKNPVNATSTPGFIVNRVARPFYAEALRVLQEGATNVATIDAVMKESGGFKMGPLELTDLIGQDVNYSVTNSVFNAFYQDQRFTPSNIQLELVNAGHLGRKTGKGFYDYHPTDEQSTPAAQTVLTLSKQDAPLEIDVFGHSQAISVLAKQANTAGIKVVENALTLHPLSGVKVGDAWLTLTDGRTATQYSAEESIDNCVFYDLALNYADSTRVLLSKSEQCSDAAFNSVVGLYQQINKAVSVLKDVPGMLVMRTVCMLANEGADVVNQQVCTLEAVDTAMQSGVNYPKGPMEWADEIGVITVVNTLDNLATHYGEDRYRVSPLLRQHYFGSTNLLG